MLNYSKAKIIDLYILTYLRVKILSNSRTTILLKVLYYFIKKSLTIYAILLITKLLKLLSFKFLKFLSKFLRY